MCGGLTDVLLPVAGDLAADLVGAVFAGDLSQALSTVAHFSDALPVLSLCRGALGSRPGVVVLTTCWDSSHISLVFDVQKPEEQF